MRAIQDDITMVGPPHIIFGTDGALEALLDGLAEVGLEPQRTKFQALGTTEEALADKPEWSAGRDKCKISLPRRYRSVGRGGVSASPPKPLDKKKSQKARKGDCDMKNRGPNI